MNAALLLLEVIKTSAWIKWMKTNLVQINCVAFSLKWLQSNSYNPIYETHNLFVPLTPEAVWICSIVQVTEWSLCAHSHLCSHFNRLLISLPSPRFTICRILSPCHSQVSPFIQHMTANVWKPMWLFCLDKHNSQIWLKGKFVVRTALQLMMNSYCIYSRLPPPVTCSGNYWEIEKPGSF